MKNLIFTGVATAAMVLSAPIAMASDSTVQATGQSRISSLDEAANARRIPAGAVQRMMGNAPRAPQMHMPTPMPKMGGHMPHMPAPMPHMPHVKPMPHVQPMPHMPPVNRPPVNNGGGFVSYRAPFRGFILPSYWISPSYAVNNYAIYGLRAPSNGAYWSRYYNDAVLTDRRGYVYDSVPNVPWNSYPGYAPAAYAQPVYGQQAYAQQGYAPAYQQPVYAPTMRADTTGYDAGNVSYNQGGSRAADPYIYENDEGDAYSNDTAEYEDDGYDAAPAPVRNAQGVGAPYGNGAAPSYSPAPNYGPAPQYNAAPNYGPAYNQSAPQDAYNTPVGYEKYERCLRGRGIKGGLLGTVIGGIAGNRIAGRGNRVPGSILGAAGGAIAGATIDKATSKCEKYLPREQYDPRMTGGYPQQAYPQQAPYPQAYPQAAYPAPYPTSGYPQYYPQQQQAPVITTVTVTPGTQTTTTTTTEEVVYETVYTKPVYHKKSTYRPKARRVKPRCSC
jgi:Ni/Co efflux regulator RcnB